MATPSARDRVLATATSLFYAHGIHAVGIDRIIAEAGVAKATFYHHFPTKDVLVATYLTEQSRRQREAAAALDGRPPREALLALFDAIGGATGDPVFRGCQFVNAAAEFPDEGHPVRRVVADHRAWFRALLRDRLVADGCPTADATADILVILRDGIVVGADLDDADRVRAVVRDAVERVLGPASGVSPSSSRRSGRTGARSGR